MFRPIAISVFVQPLLILNIETGLLLRLELILRGLITARIVDKIYGATIDFILRKGANSYAGRDIARISTRATVAVLTTVLILRRLLVLVVV